MTVTTSSSATVTVTKASSLATLEAGQTVAVQGTTSGDSVAATAVRIGTR